MHSLLERFESMKINDGSYGIRPLVTPDTDAGADCGYDARRDGIIRSDALLVLSLVPFFFNSFCFATIASRKFPSLIVSPSVHYHYFAFLSDEQEASKCHCLLWVLYLYQFLIFEYIASSTFNFNALH